MTAAIGDSRILSLFTTGPLLRRVRLWSGCTLFTYVLTHLLDHALANASVGAADAMLVVQKFLWQGWIGTTALYGALLTHACLGLWALYERRHFRWTAAEATQLVLGLSVPLLLANHVAGTRIGYSLFGLDKGYVQEFYSLWVASPLWWGLIQVTVLVVAWTHGCIGLHFLLRLKPWYGRAHGVLLACAVVVPVLALLGFVQGGRSVARDVPRPGWRAAQLGPEHTGTKAQVATLAWVRQLILGIDGGAILLVFAARGVRVWRETRRGRVAIAYPDGRLVRVPRGMSVLDASRLGGIDHASVCGGRGRCSTCRVRVFESLRDLPEPAAAERRVLESVGADPALVRLACQLRPRGDLGVAPLVPPEVAQAFVAGRRRSAGEERFVVAMFVDMRGSARMVEQRLPFDSVFLLGRFIAAVAAAVVEAGGLPNQFMGDGILALFGVRAEPPRACAQALDAVARITRNLRDFNRLFARELPAPIGFGIGAHCGRAVVGEIGFRRHVTFTALGETVNTAARLQALTRELDCESLISEDIFRIAGAGPPGGAPREVQLRGRSAPLSVHMAGGAREA